MPKELSTGPQFTAEAFNKPGSGVDVAEAHAIAAAIEAGRNPEPIRYWYCLIHGPNGQRVTVGHTPKVRATWDETVPYPYLLVLGP